MIMILLWNVLKRQLLIASLGMSRNATPSNEVLCDNPDNDCKGGS